jgi:signal transduction histidine kinase
VSKRIDAAAWSKRRGCSERENSIELRKALQLVAEQAVAAGGGLVCLISWQIAESIDTVHHSADAGWDSAVAPLRALVQRRLEYAAGTYQLYHFQAGELAAHLDGQLPGGILAQGFVSSTSADDIVIETTMLAPLGRSVDEVRALTKMTAVAGRARIEAHLSEASRKFWCDRATLNGERIALADNQRSAALAEQTLIESTVAACLKLSVRNRLADLGAAVAAVGPFDAWFVATGTLDKLRIIAASTAFVPIPQLERKGAIADAMKRDAIVFRQPGKHPACEEDRLFAGRAEYCCAPFGSGAIALAASRKIDQAMRDRIEKLMRRLGPIIEKWVLQDELNSLHRLVRTLGLRLFNAIDGERQRIARDLHDHQSQLLAAARIALEADPDEARGILKQLDDVLRLRVRELRPATLGRSDLREALRHEMRRLADAGIRARLLHPEGIRALSRPVQQLCYQVVREAFSNVIRHAGATRVTIAVEKRAGLACITIDDNGTGIPASKAGRESGRSGGGMGWVGIGERVGLMGGRFNLERIDNITRLTVEVPEL